MATTSYAKKTSDTSRTRKKETSVTLEKAKGDASHKSRESKTKKQKDRHNIELGARGEEAAARFLEKRGYTILERNWTCIAGEADIIALDDEGIHFVEVKTRRGEGKGFPEEAVDAKKRRRYEAISELYFCEYDGFETWYTFDIISINVLDNGRATMRIYRNVLSCDCR